MIEILVKRLRSDVHLDVLGGDLIGELNRRFVGGDDRDRAHLPPSRAGHHSGRVGL